MQLHLQLMMLFISLSFLVFIVYNIRKTKLDVHYSIVWVIIACFLIVLSIYPNLLNIMANLLHIANPVFALFFLAIIFLCMLSFYTFVKVTHHRKEIKNLTYELARLEKELKSRGNNHE